MTERNLKRSKFSEAVSIGKGSSSRYEVGKDRETERKTTLKYTLVSGKEGTGFTVKERLTIIN